MLEPCFVCVYVCLVLVCLYKIHSILSPWLCLALPNDYQVKALFPCVPSVSSGMHKTLYFFCLCLGTLSLTGCVKTIALTSFEKMQFISSFHLVNFASGFW